MVFKRLREDIKAYMERDPAAKSPIEIILCYPGFHALLYYRLTHWLWGHRFHLAARFIAHIGKILTAIEIHPGAEIGRRFVIDHGTGVVIGETAVVGDDVTIYHAVTLGGIAPSVDSHTQVGVKRHPTLEDGVIVGSGAQILGPITVGSGARIGSNSVVTRDIPGAVTAVGIPARVVMPKDKSRAGEFQAYGTPSDGCPDPVLNTIDDLRRQLTALASRVKELEAEKPESVETPVAPQPAVGEATSKRAGRG